MPNIYLRLPTYCVAFYRNREIGHPLAPDKPVVFLPFSQEYAVLSIGARVMQERAMLRSHCWSQIAWKNMMAGRAPSGGQRILLRDNSEWLSTAEVRALTDDKEGGSFSEASDYLCIQLPREVQRGEYFVRANNSYSLDGKCAEQLDGLLRHEFQQTFLDWLIQDRRFCNQKNVARSRMESIERFLMTYDIPVSADNKERDSLRRMVNRWLGRAKVLINDRLNFEDGFFRHLSDAEIAQINTLVTEGKEEVV